MDVPQKPRTEQPHDPETLPLGTPKRTEVGMEGTHTLVCTAVMWKQPHVISGGMDKDDMIYVV